MVQINDSYGQCNANESKYLCKIRLDIFRDIMADNCPHPLWLLGDLGVNGINKSMHKNWVSFYNGFVNSQSKYCIKTRVL